MYAYIDRKKEIACNHSCCVLLVSKAIRIFLKSSILAEEVKVTKANLKKSIGRKLAARVLKTWVEDFVDEDTGEVVSIERNDVIIRP